jgi:hypothetical protein
MVWFEVGFVLLLLIVEKDWLDLTVAILYSAAVRVVASPHASEFSWSLSLQDLRRTAH